MLQFRLAIALGYPHPDHLLAQLTSHQYSELLAFHSIEPIGEEREDLRNAMAIAAMVNALGAKPRAKIDNYLPWHSKDRPKSDEELWRKIENMFPAETNGDGESLSKMR